MDTKQAGNLSYRISILLDKQARVGDTSGIKCWGWAKAHAARFGGNPSGAGAFHDQGTLEIRHAGEHGEDHAASRSGSVGPRVDLAKRSRRVTVTTSPARRCSSRRPSSGLSRFAPLTFSSKIRVQPAS